MEAEQLFDFPESNKLSHTKSKHSLMQYLCNTAKPAEGGKSPLMEGW